MSFKENLLTKIRIDKMAHKVTKSIETTDAGSRADKTTMRELLSMSAYHPRRERDLELFIRHEGSDTQKILVLDNELALYNTTVDDVVLRKSPTLKEMISFRNARKILNDSDVLICKKGDTVSFFQNELISKLDLSYDRTDLLEIENDGVASLERGYSDGITQTLELYSELLGFSPLPKEFMISGSSVIGQSGKTESGGTRYGPFIIYSIIHNIIRLFDEKIGIYDKDKIEQLRMAASGKVKASEEGPAVFKYLTDAVLNKIENKR